MSSLLHRGDRSKAEGQELPQEAPTQLVEGIGGFEMKVLGLWRFEFKNVYSQHVQIDACTVEGYRDAICLARIL